VRLLGADVAGLVVLNTVSDGSAWRGVTGNHTDVWRDQRYGGGHPAAGTIFSGKTEVLHAPGGVLDANRFPFFSAEGVRVAVSVPLDPLDGSHGALCLGWRFDAQIAPPHLELAEALAAFSGALVVSATAVDERDAIIANAPVILVAVNADGFITLCEGAAAAAIGVGREQVGLSLPELLRDAPAVRELLDAAFADGASDRVEVELRGRVLDIRVESREGGSFLVGTDVTERRAAERELVRRAIEDDLTGLPNQAEVERRVAAVLPDEPVCAVIADVRNFDQINEAIGYAAGD
jgi:PAS domain-containing protein